MRHLLARRLPHLRDATYVTQVPPRVVRTKSYPLLCSSHVRGNMAIGPVRRVPVCLTTVVILRARGITVVAGLSTACLTWWLKCNLSVLLGATLSVGTVF